MSELITQCYIGRMRNLCSILSVFVFIAAGSFAHAAKKGQPDRNSRINCARALHSENPRYQNSFEEDRRRYEAGPDETEDRNPEERDARDPGDF